VGAPQAQRVAAEGVAFGDLGGDEGEGGPEGEGPGETDEGDEERGGGGGADGEGAGHAGGEEEVGEQPGAAEGEAGDLEGGEEVGEAVRFLLGGWGRGEVFGHGGREGAGGAGGGGAGVVGVGGLGFEVVGRGLVGGGDEEGEEQVGGEGGDGEDEEGEGADARRIFPFRVDFRGRHVRVGFEDGVDVQLADVGGDVEEEREPADPVEELDFAYPPDLRR